MRRHFTATGFVVDGGRTLLHWHKRLQQWMPPGGHIEPDENPVQAVLREIREETGLEAEVIPSIAALSFSYPAQLQPPYTILLEDSPEPGDPHQHIDLIYFCRLRDGAANERLEGDFRWVDEAALRSNQPLDLAACGVMSVPLAEDVRLLALQAIEAGQRAMGKKKEGANAPLSNLQSPISDGDEEGKRP